METVNKKAISENLKVFSPIFNDNAYIEITEWTNEEGWDIDINGEKYISLHMDELDAINYLVNHMRYYFKK